MNDTIPYIPPKVWTPPESSGGRFANINRPVAGATHDKELPVGKHPLQLYSLGTPNGVKVTVMLEELLAAGHTGAEYDAWLVRINQGEQFGSGFVAINPNSKIPALVDHSGPQPVRVFESGAILLYLAEKFGAFVPTEPIQSELLELTIQPGSGADHKRIVDLDLPETALIVLIRRNTEFIVPRGATAMTDTALGRLLAASVVPSIGSTATSHSGPVPSPTSKTKVPSRSRISRGHCS